MINKPNHLRISTKRGQRRSLWRAGINFTSLPTTLALADLTTEQVAQIKADHRLQIERICLSTRPDNQADAITQLVDAINQLDKTAPDNWTAGGEPKVPTLTAALGWAVTAAERDTAWAQVNED